MRAALRSELFDELSQWLREHRSLWSSRPFVSLPVAWEKTLPETSKALRALDIDTIEAFEMRPWDLPHMPATFVALSQKAQRFARPFQLTESSQCSRIPARPRKIRARKWSQINTFVQAAKPPQQVELKRWVDWCSGMGHLGRRLAELSSYDVICVEKEMQLIQAGQQLLQGQHVPVTFRQADVFTDPLNELLDPQTGVAALHACGQLNMRLLQLAAKQPCAYLAIAPCCYQRIHDPTYPPLSQQGRVCDLRLSIHQLRLVAFDEVVATQKQKQQRRKEQAWRLAFDLLQQEASGKAKYRPVSQVPNTWLRGSFYEFCSRLSQREEIDLPAGFDPQTAEDRGWQKLTPVRALGMLRALFKRPLEIWLLLDRLLFLEEHGYKAELSTFCSIQLTPRNLLITAQPDHKKRSN